MAFWPSGTEVRCATVTNGFDANYPNNNTNLSVRIDPPSARAKDCFCDGARSLYRARRDSCSYSGNSHQAVRGPLRMEFTTSRRSIADLEFSLA